MSALKFLLGKEWEMGNGQCPECEGVPSKWHGHPLHKTAESIGHEKMCPLAASINELGGDPLMKGEYKSNIVYESYISDNGFYGTRPKTKNGCPNIRKLNDRLDQEMFDAMNRQLVEENK